MTTQRVLTPRQMVLFLILSLVNLAAIVNVGICLLGFRDWERQPIIVLVIVLLLLVFLGSQQVRWFLLPFMKRPILPELTRPWKVGVATTFVPGAEPIELLDRTVRALVALDYPHETWVLDEGDDPRVRQLCRELGALHYSRKSDPRYQVPTGRFASRTKYGNYNAWLTEHAYDRYEIVTVFDTDHVPDARFLKRVLPCFEDSRIGYVQVAQAYGNQGQSWIARGAAEETYDYFSTIQMAGYGMGYPIIVGGHNSHRVAALREIGGFAPHDADDILTTLHYRDAGWEGVYIPEILARGLTPADLPSYLTQQRRWARSVLDLKLRVAPRRSRSMPQAARLLSYLHGLNYLLKGLLPLAALFVVGVTCVTGSDLQMLSSAAVPSIVLLLGALGLAELYRQQFYLDPPREWGLHGRAMLLHWARWPQMVWALGDVLRNRRVPYTITPKEVTRGPVLRELVPHLVTSGLLAGCWAAGLWKGNATVVHHAVVALVLISTLVLILSGAGIRTRPALEQEYPVCATRPR